MAPVLVAHVAFGTVAIASGLIAAAARKGGPIHRGSGRVFLVSMACMAAFGFYLAMTLPRSLQGATPPQASASIAVLAVYLVCSAWAAARNRQAHAGPPEYGAFACSTIIAAALFAFGTRARLSGGLAGPYFAFASFALLCAVLDFRVLQKGGIVGVPRLSRHLWRMCCGLFFASAFFFIGQQRVMPVGLRGSPVLLLLAVLPLLIMGFWLLRVRMRGRWLLKAVNV